MKKLFAVVSITALVAVSAMAFVPAAGATTPPVSGQCQLAQTLHASFPLLVPESAVVNACRVPTPPRPSGGGTSGLCQLVELLHKHAPQLAPASMVTRYCGVLNGVPATK